MKKRKMEGREKGKEGERMKEVKEERKWMREVGWEGKKRQIKDKEITITGNGKLDKTVNKWECLKWWSTLENI